MKFIFIRDKQTFGFQKCVLLELTYRYTRMSLWSDGIWRRHLLETFSIPNKGLTNIVKSFIKCFAFCVGSKVQKSMSKTKAV